MKHLLTLAASLLVAGSAATQVTVTGKLSTDMTATVQCGRNTPITDTEKQDTTFDRNIGVQAVQKMCASAMTMANVGSMQDSKMGRNVSSATVKNHGSVSTDSVNQAARAMSGGDRGHGVSFTFSAASDTKGTLVILLGGDATRGQAAFAAVKVGDRPLESWKAGDAPKKITVPDYELKARMPLVVDTVSGGSALLTAAGTASYQSYVSIQFLWGDTGGGKVTITDEGGGCKSTTLTGKVTSTMPMGHNIELTLASGVPNSFGLNLFSADGKVTNQQCQLFTGIFALGVFPTDANGGAKHYMRAPGGRDYTIWTMDVVLMFTPSGIDHVSSNVLKIAVTAQ